MLDSCEINNNVLAVLHHRFFVVTAYTGTCRVNAFALTSTCIGININDAEKCASGKNLNEREMHRV